MKLLLIYLPYIISSLIGYLLLMAMSRGSKQTPSIFLFVIGCGLGLGFSAMVTFLSFIIFNKLNVIFVITVNLLSLVALSAFCLVHKNPRRALFATFKNFSFPSTGMVLLIILFSVPLWYSCHFYTNGGWDAWATWNLKAKFLFLGEEHWRGIFDPVMWRSSPHYPLLLPLINVWGWIFLKEPEPLVTIFSSFLFTFLSVTLIYAGVKKLTNKVFIPFCSSVLLVVVPFFNKLALSQYSDIVLGFYLLAGFLCLIVAKEDDCPISALVGGLMVGFLSFTKSEGLILSVLTAAGSIPFLLWRNTSKDKYRLLIHFIIGATIAFIIPIIFYGFYAPNNQTFINGFTSKLKPANIFRLKVIFAFYVLEFICPKWNGILIFLFAGLLLSFGRCYHRKVNIIPLVLASYGAILTIYYLTNTYFQIEWWLQVTLHRIIFALLPTITFWTVYALFGIKQDG